jgi:hypothetical protein
MRKDSNLHQCRSESLKLGREIELLDLKIIKVKGILKYSDPVAHRTHSVSITKASQPFNVVL